ncbi:MAG TPA: NAD(P)-dependent oxidoreductase [Acidimicrobiales bacterium]|nr:NAD(P)-dependent oxidoreductase [Acidimicrobiales bacterium]
MTTELEGAKILITGLTGSVGFPIAKRLAAAGSQVYGGARFSSARRRARIEEAGVNCVQLDLIEADFSDVPDDVDYVINFAVLHAPDFDTALAANAEGIGLLMAHCRKARAILHCSSTGVYQPDGHHAFAETDPLGDNHRPAGLTTYSISKIAAEAVARQSARLWNLPTVIPRLNVPYGDTWGWPKMQLDMMISGAEVAVHSDPPSLYNPIHEDDIFGLIPALLAAATVPATIVNWAGPDTVSVQEWCGYLGELVGVEPRFAPTDAAIPSVAVDITKMRELIGEPAVGWRDGFRRMAEASFPELVKPKG